MKHLFLILTLCLSHWAVAQMPKTTVSDLPISPIETIETSTPIKDANVAEELDEIAMKYAATITAADMKKHLTTLASDEYGGRGTGQEGQQKAAAYITEFYQKWNLPTVGKDNGYYHPVPLIEQGWSENMSITVKKQSFNFLDDFYCFPRYTSDINLKKEKIMFLGYGIEDPFYDDYFGVNVEGKTLMVLADEPINEEGTFYVSKMDIPSEWSTNSRKKAKKARSKGVKTLLVVVKDYDESMNYYENWIKGTSMKLQKSIKKRDNKMSTVFISSKVANEILKRNKVTVEELEAKINASGKPYNFKVKNKVSADIKRYAKQIEANNILGFVEGSDLKDEIIVVTAHYDHIGTIGKNINNGADDNGSGTTTVLEMVEAMVKAKEEGNGPRRSVLFMHVTAEEKGLLGSKHYANEDPVYPLEKTVACINTDMVGRKDDKHEDYNYVYVIGADKLSSELHDINERMNRLYTKLNLDYTYNDENDPNRFYYRSDHYNFAEKGIPSIFFFNGTHADYHKPTDTVEKINFEAMQTRGRLIFHTLWQLANQDKRIEVDEDKR
ncbi:MAG: M28 family peptidase [Chitinophagales bacterium]